MIAKRDFFVNELRNKLNKKYPQGHKDIEKVIQEFCASSWLSDHRTVPEFIRTKSEYSGWGPHKISQKLKERGVDGTLIKEQIEEAFSTDKQLELAQNLAKEKWNLLQNKKAAERTAAVQRFLASRGFDFNIIISATKALSDL